MKKFIVLLLCITGLISCKDKDVRNKEVKSAKIKVGSVAIPVNKNTLSKIKDEVGRLKNGEKRELINRDYRPPIFDNNDPYLEINVKDKLNSKTYKILYPLLPDKANIGYADNNTFEGATALATWDGMRTLKWFKKFMPEIKKGNEAKLKTSEEREIIEQCKKDLADFLGLRKNPELVSFEKVNFKNDFLDEIETLDKNGINGYKIRLLAKDKIYLYHAASQRTSHLVDVEKLKDE